MLAHLVLAEEKGRSPILESERVLGMTFLRATIPLPHDRKERVVRRRLDKAARLLLKAGVRRVLVQEDFSRWEVLREWGMMGVDPSGLCQTLASPLAVAALKRRGIPLESAIVALRGSRVSRPLFQAALELAPQVRALMIAAPVEGKELGAHLRREYGVPILEEGAGRPPDLSVNFSDLPEGMGETLKLYAPINLSDVRILLKEGTWPMDFEPLSLAAALWEGGALEKGGLDCV